MIPGFGGVFADIQHRSNVGENVPHMLSARHRWADDGSLFFIDRKLAARRKR